MRGWVNRGARRWALLVAAVPLLAAHPVAAREAVLYDAEVVEARQDLEAANAGLSRVTAQLDEAAAAYERAHAHHLRLRREVRASAGSVERAHARTAAAMDAFAERVAHAYMNPGTQSDLTEVVLEAPDATTALRRVEMLTQLAVRAGREVVEVTEIEVALADSARQRQVVEVGSARAAADRRLAADALIVAVEQAAADLRAARRKLADAKDAAARRIAARDAELTSPPTDVAGGPVVTEGKACPVGQPNGFIDSWGFPRSGGRTHQGVDIFAEYGTAVYAVADGTVEDSSNSLGGLVVFLHADGGDKYYYAHLAEESITDGQRVRAGDLVGAVGDSGNARGTPPHLHWEYHPGAGDPINPYPLAAALCRS